MNHYIKSKIALAISGLILLASCGNQKTDNNIEISTDYLDIKIGSDFTDLNAKLIFLTNRTDLIQDTPEGREFPYYIADFNKLYPGISVTVEGITDYDIDMAARLFSGNWGIYAVCLPQ